MNEQILVVDDTAANRHYLRMFLEEHDYRISEAEDAESALKALERGLPNLILLDVHMEGMDGFELLSVIRERYGYIPAIFVTGLRELHNELNGYERGADDYIARPFEPPVLVAKVKALLRRSTITNPPATKESPRQMRLKIDSLNQTVWIPGRGTVKLTPNELRLLSYFNEHFDETLSADEILRNVWGIDRAGELLDDDSTGYEKRDPINNVQVYVGRLRNKLGSAGGTQLVIKTIIGSGYRMSVEVKTVEPS